MNLNNLKRKLFTFTIRGYKKITKKYEKKLHVRISINSKLATTSPCTCLPPMLDPKARDDIRARAVALAAAALAAAVAAAAEVVTTTRMNEIGGICMHSMPLLYKTPWPLRHIEINNLPLFSTLIYFQKLSFPYWKTDQKPSFFAWKVLEASTKASIRERRWKRERERERKVRLFFIQKGFFFAKFVSPEAIKGPGFPTVQVLFIYVLFFFHAFKLIFMSLKVFTKYES